jgi:heme-degrading monooxygenase HmoA
MVQVVFRWKTSKLSACAFRQAWHRAMTAIQRHAKGALGGELLRSQGEPGEFVIVTRWESMEAWRDFWSHGPPEPQGDAARNEFFVELDRVEPQGD